MRLQKAEQQLAEKHWPDIQEALIGVLFVLASSASVLLLADNPHGGEQLKNLLVGQILWVNYQQLLPIAAIYSILLGVWFKLQKRLSPIVFYLIFAIAITASVQLVGVYLVFASLIIPALATRNLSYRRQLPVAWLIGFIGYIAGISLSIGFDYPTGPLIVLAMAIIATMSAWMIPTAAPGNPEWRLKHG
ncbi:MAG: metal ABC transporter permease [Xanthomonadales bacterium]|nr:metal ABC transporter permease [Xanthomonadales bacterium]